MLKEGKDSFNYLAKSIIYRISQAAGRAFAKGVSFDDFRQKLLEEGPVAPQRFGILKGDMYGQLSEFRFFPSKGKDCLEFLQTPGLKVK